MKKICFACVLIMLGCSCTSKLSTTKLKEGKIRAKTEYPTFTDTTFTRMAAKTEIISHKWYKGNWVIEEEVMSKTETVNGKTTERLITTGYVFMDFKTRKAYEYATFSDTARPLQTFALYDTVNLSGGTMYWGAKFVPSNLSRQIHMITDTLIDGIIHKRAVRSYTKNTYGRLMPFIQIYYLRPDISEDLGRIYFWQDSLTRALKAPIVRVEEKFSINSGEILGRASLFFLADTLSVQERKVFTAWKNNEKTK